MAAKRFEVAVVGAGPVGLLFAFRLARRSAGAFAIRLLDIRRPRRWQEDQVDPRVYALSRESQHLLAEVWPAVLARRASPYRRMRVFETEAFDGLAAIDFDAAEIGEPDLGHIVEDSLLRDVLLDAVQGLGCEIEFGRGVDSLEAHGGRRRLVCADGTAIDCDLVVGADGAKSRIRELANIDVVRKDYGQIAIVAHVETQQPHRETAWQRFLPSGPLAFLPLNDGRCSIVWSVDDAGAERLLAMTESEFLQALEAASGGLLGKLGPCSERFSFPLACQHAARYTRPGVALIGDAAHAVHPLAGQGMNLGLRDAEVLAATLASAQAAGEYPADEFVLGRYARAQKAHNVAMQLAFDGINELYGPRWPEWMQPIRRFGMAAVDGMMPAKRFLMRQALGLDRATVGRSGDHAS